MRKARVLGIAWCVDRWNRDEESEEIGGGMEWSYCDSGSLLLRRSNVIARMLLFDEDPGTGAPINVQWSGCESWKDERKLLIA